MLSQIENFVNWVRRRNPAARTWRDYTYDLHQFATLTGDRPPAKITFRVIDQFVNSQVSRGFQPATINRRLAAILALNQRRYRKLCDIFRGCCEIRNKMIPQEAGNPYRQASSPKPLSNVINTLSSS